MKKVVAALCLTLLVVLFCCSCTAEILIQEGRVTGEKEIDGKYFTYDFALPSEIQHVKQYKTKLVSMKPSKVKSIIEGFAQKPRPGDWWSVMDSSRWSRTNFCYFEENGKYVCEGSYYGGPSKRVEGQRYEEACDTVSALLAALDVTGFETPFYVYTSQIRSCETIFEPIVSDEDYLRAIGCSEAFLQAAYQEACEKEELGKERTLVLARFLIDGIPLCISDTSPHIKENELDETIGTAGIFMLNENMEILRAQIRNYVQVIDSREDAREILPWQDCIDIIAQATQPHMRVIITEVELNLCVGKNGMTYPVWRFAGYSDSTSHPEYPDNIDIIFSDFSCCVDAYTGQCLH